MSRSGNSTSVHPQLLRTWLMRIGFIGEEFATARDFLTRNLTGDVAFRNGRAA